MVVIAVGALVASQTTEIRLANALRRVLTAVLVERARSITFTGYNLKRLEIDYDLR